MVAGAPAMPVTKRLQDGADVLALGAFLLAAALYLAFSPALFNDGDTSWHLATGRLILETGAIPTADPFSFTAVGTPWTAHEWLAEVMMASAFSIGWSGLAALTAAAVAGLLAILAAELRRWLAMRHLILALTALAIVLMPFILARPHVLAWPLLALWTTILIRAREKKAAPHPAAALLMLLWANLHASFFFGLGLAGLFALEALLMERSKQRTMISWGLFGLLSLAAAIATPHGASGLLFPLQVSGMETLPLIQEWRRTSLAEDGLFLALTGAAGALFLYRRPRVAPLRFVLLGGLVVLALMHARHQPLLWIVGTLLLARPLGAAQREKGSQASMATLWLAIALAVAAVRLPIPMERRQSETTPLQAIRSVPAELRSRPVLNSYGFGGPLILAGIRPFVDGRADMYGDAHILEHQRIVEGDLAAFRRVDRRWSLGWTILEPGTPLAAKLDHEPGWRRLHADEFAIIHVRRH